MHSNDAVIEKTGRLKQGVLWVVSLLRLTGKTGLKRRRGELAPVMKPEVSLNPPKTLVVLNRTSYRKIGGKWFQLTPTGARISLTHFENYTQIEQMLEEKARVQTW